MAEVVREVVRMVFIGVNGGRRDSKMWRAIGNVAADSKMRREA